MPSKKKFGDKAIIDCRNRINELHLVVKGNRGWQMAFFFKYAHLDTAEGARTLAAVCRGKCCDIEVLRCFEEFIPFIIKTQPEWFKKQLKIEIPTNEATE